LPDLGVTKSTDPVSRAASLRTLTSLLPDLTNTILNLYARAWTFTDDKLPPLAFSQSAVRFAKLLSAIRIHHGHLDDVLLRHLVLNTDLPLEENPSLEAVPFLTRGEVVELLFRAYPGPPSEMSMTIADHTTVLAGIASVLSTLGYHRKKALVLRELMISLLPALVQARKDGAAEMGVHPAASLATLNATVNAIPLENNGASLDDAEQGMRCFLWIVCRSYGIVPPEPSRGLDAEATATLSDQPSKGPSSPDGAQIAEVIAFRALQQASAKAAGPPDLKIDVLRSCINVCEALPDLVGALQFSAYLLRIGGSGIAPGPESSDGSPELVIEEQVRLVNNIYRTLSAARQLGIEHPEAEYWDDFLIRGIEPVKAHSLKGVQPHAKSELELVSTMDAQKEKNPFIYNPFSKTKTSATREPLLVAKEESFFRITMQNLYDFEIVAERVRLLSDGVEFDCEAQATIIGPYRTQTIILSGTPLASGSLTIYGCSVKVKGCRERSYPTFSEPWSLKSGIKQRPWDLAGKSRLTSAASGEDKKPRLPLPPSPTASTLALKVLGAQPNVTLKSMSAPQAAIMLLEGESKILKLSLQNTSRLIPADLVLLSFDDSTTSQRQSTLPDQELSAIELHELELASASKQSIKLRHTNMTRDIEIEPGGETNIDIDLLGKPGLSYGTIQVDYGHLGTARADVKETFYTRQLVIPLTVTVNQSIEIIQADIVALPHNILPKQQLPHNQAAPGAESSTQDHTPSSTSSPPNFLNPGDSTSSSPPQCLLLLDFRNSWSNDLTLTLKVSDPSSTSSPTIHSQQIQPGTTQRVPLPLPRLYISNPHAPIPSLNPANKRQFVVSATKHTPEAERAMRESFWYREALLGRLKATWREDGTGRSGDVDLRRLRLSPPMLAALKLPDLEISMSVTSAEPASSSSSSDGEDIEEVHMTKPSTYRVSTTIFLTLSTHLYNRSSSPIQPLIRLQPTLANHPQHVALDLSKKLLVNGLLQRALPTLRPGERKAMDTGFLVLSYGIYEWRASVEEVFTPGKEGNEIGRKRAATGELDVLTDMERRTWLAESPCTVIARDANEHVEASRYLDDR